MPAQEARTDELVQALGTISALTMVTILWITFTVLEAADVTGPRLFGRWRTRRIESEEEEEGVEGSHIFCTTWIELALGMVLLGLWAGKSPFWFHLNGGADEIVYHFHAQVIIAAFIPSRSAGLSKLPLLSAGRGQADDSALIKVSYTIAMSSLALLQVHLILSIICHAFWQGGIVGPSFWTERTGWWVGVGKIRLAPDRSEEVSEKV
jgi:hypothetical protein